MKVFGVNSKKYLHSMCLSGDSGDCIPGIGGIGEKKALGILKTNPNIVKDILNNNWDSDKFVGTENMKNLILANIDTIFLARKLVTINKHISKMNKIEGRKNLDRIESIFEKYEFFSLLKGEPWKIISKW